MSCIERCETQAAILLYIIHNEPDNSFVKSAIVNRKHTFVVENLGIKVMNVHLSHHRSNNNLSLKFLLCVMARKNIAHFLEKSLQYDEKQILFCLIKDARQY